MENVLEKPKLLVIEFDEEGIISNLEELFKDVPYSTPDRFGSKQRSVLAWIKKEDKIVLPLSFDHYAYVWGEVLIGIGYSTQPNIDGKHYYYRIHKQKESFMIGFKNKAASSTEFIEL